MPNDTTPLKPKNGTAVYDMSGPEPVLGEVPHEQLGEALGSGRFHMPKGVSLDVLDPDGNLGTIPGEHAAEALKAGYKVAGKYENSQVTAGVLGAADSMSMGLAGAIMDPIASMLGAQDPAAERLAIKQQNPGSYVAGQVAGILAPGGMGKAMGELGTAGAAAAGLGAPASAMGRIGSMATKGAIENMVFQSGDEVSKVLMHDPELSVEHALTDVGLAGLIGGGLGGAFGAVPELWKLGRGKAAEARLNMVKAANEGIPVEQMKALNLSTSPELSVALGDNVMAKNLFETQLQSETIAGRNAQKSMVKLTDALDTAAADTFGHTPESLASLDNLSMAKTGRATQDELVSNIKQTYEPIAESFDKLETKFAQTVVQPVTRDEATHKLTQLIVDEGLLKSKAAQPMLHVVQDALEDLPKQANAQDLRLLIQNLRNGNPFGKESYHIAKKVTNVLQEALDGTLEHGANGAGLGSEFKATQQQYAGLRGMMQDLNDYLHAGKVRGTESFSKQIANMDPEAVIKRLSQERVELRSVLQKHFPQVEEAVNKYKLDDVLASSRKDGVLNIKKLTANIAKLEPETKQALFKPEQLKRLSAIQNVVDRLPKNKNPSGTAKTIEALMSSPAAAMAGVLLGGGTGGVAAIALQAFGKEVTAGGRSAMLRFLASAEPTSAGAFKQALGMAQSVERGQNLLNKATKAVFEAKNGTAVVAEDTSKLRKAVDAMTQDESKLMNVGADLGHYMPEQAAAAGASAMRAVRYLSSLKPAEVKLAPLDNPRKVADDKEAAYERALQIAQQPLLILNGVKDGRVNPTDLQHLNQLYPALSKHMQTKLSSTMIESLSKGVNVPYKTALGLSAFMGQPMASSLTPQAITAAQGAMKAQGAKQAQQGQMSRGNSLGKLAASYMTPTQSKTAHRAK